ncbi:hypothetical protein [Paenibacillus harenae]|uniref:hypothetical protein n=1 Tax=Paenibacillus harenae TaxID=306543 RepID=UPI002790D380|nr:hypothetical protein [Paenibacillus harenae]MDQ0063621.1 hypothetical protein [Paenibacillus harenae]
MHQWTASFISFAATIGQFVFGAIALRALLQLLPRRHIRWKHLSLLSWRTKETPESLLRLFRVSRKSAAFAERELLLGGCGYTLDAAWYALARKIGISASVVAATIMLLIAGSLHMLTASTSYTVGGLLIAALLLMVDKTWLASMRKVRVLRMTKEIYAVSNQLLYLSDSTLHIHAKLLRCVPFTRALRPELERLLAEWYHDAGEALQRFKRKLGTDEGLSFVETIDALRQHESIQYYDILRARIEDYKEKLELAKESKKESTSYVLFIVAGIPILYTFQVFIYPWVREGQKLFQSLS